MFHCMRGCEGKLWAEEAVQAEREVTQKMERCQHKIKKIETIYREARGYSSSYFKDSVLEATTDGNGNVTFDYARGGQFKKEAKTNRTNYVTYEISAGAVNGVPFGVNWDKVNSISGRTYDLKSYAKEAGLSWDGVKKMWVRKK